MAHVYTLRLNHVAVSAGQHQVEATFQKDGQPLQTAASPLSFALSSQDQEDVRWYLEDYLQYPLDPAPTVAERIERRMAEIGKELFRGIFQQNDDAKKLWAAALPQLNNIRVEIIAEAGEAATIPWELIRDPKTGVLLALRVPSFVRASSQTVKRSPVSPGGAGAIRVLLVICRPRGADDVPFRSVAKRLLKGLGQAQREIIHLEVLRPPTFEQLGHELRVAQANGEPYHIVHFDGHGSYGDSGDGDRGYLMFENPVLDDNLDPVDGSKLGNLLAETDVPVLILNACRSAHAAPPPQPEVVAGGPAQNEARTFGSLAQEVAQAGAGATGVVAMRYNVFVVTAAQFMADLYGSLVQGQTLGQAVTLGRKQLQAQPLRGIAFDPVALQDWFVPVVFETVSIALFPKQSGAPTLKITLGEEKEAAPGGGTLDAKLPPRPDAGFFGRDETLLALDRAFDSQSVVLLHAYAGSGKTTTAAEFARWYSLTGGVKGPVIFTSFERHKPLARVLDDFGNVFQDALEKSGVQWGALDDAKRRNVALQVLQQVPVLWIWDNVEQVAGFPSGTDSKWSHKEQRELADFLRAARDAGTTSVKPKFLLTSRRDEQSWLGGLPRRIPVPPMPFLERVELARALAEKHGRRLTDVQDWRPLLQFTQGNPMTITVLVGQALRDGLHSRKQIEAFVARLRAGEAVFKDEKSEGRTRSLGVALNYGFENAFTDPERRQLARLHLFQGFINVDVLRAMGNREIEGHLQEIRGLDRDTGIALLDRAAEVGLLTTYGGGYYSIHPALPWFFKKMFDGYYADSVERAGQAFVEAVAELGDYYAQQYGNGARDVIELLIAEEPNLLHARYLARSQGWWDALTGTMQGLMVLYLHTGRSGEWARLVNEIVPDFVDPAHGGPMPGREEDWSLVSGYRVRLARESRQWAEAERLQTARIGWNRQHASTALALPAEGMNQIQRNRIRSLVASLHELAEIQREQGYAKCVEIYKQSYELALRIQDKPSAAVVAYNLGNAYKDLPALRDLDQAESWFRRSLDLYPDADQMGRAQCLSQLGNVSLQRFLDARKASKPDAELMAHMENALHFYLQGLDLLPSSAIRDLAVIHGQLGVIYRNAGDSQRALEHYRKSISYEESAGNLYGAAQTRFNVALALARDSRFADAQEYALAALRNFQTYGAGAAQDVQQTLKLIADIERVITADSGKQNR
jgi:tetratricopeptide (TPR) repeat protein